MDVRAGIRPLKQIAGSRFNVLPCVRPGKHIGILPDELGALNTLLHHLIDLSLRRPDVLEVDIFTSSILAERFAVEINIDRTCDGVGHNQRRRRKVVGANIRADAAFEVAVSAQHARHDKILGVDRIVDWFWKRPRVADACRATESDCPESHCFKVFKQPPCAKVVRHDL